MSSSGGIVGAIGEAMSCGAWETAEFLAERVHAREGGEHSALLLAQCLLARGRPACAAQLLLAAGRPVLPESRFVLARAQTEMRMHREAMETLTAGKAIDDHTTDWMAAVPRGAFGLALLGTVCRALQQRERAIACFRAALAIQPFMWTAAEQLCALGAEEDPLETVIQQQQEQQQAKLFGGGGVGGVPVSPAGGGFASPAFATPAPYQGSLRFAFDTPQTADHHQVAPQQQATDDTSSWLKVVKQFGHIRWLRSKHQPGAVLVAVKSLDEKQRLSPAARVENARALAELGDYGLAAKEFIAVRKCAPWRFEGMEV